MPLILGFDPFLLVWWCAPCLAWLQPTPGIRGMPVCMMRNEMCMLRRLHAINPPNARIHIFERLTTSGKYVLKKPENCHAEG